MWQQLVWLSSRCEVFSMNTILGMLRIQLSFRLVIKRIHSFYFSLVDAFFFSFVDAGTFEHETLGFFRRDLVTFSNQRTMFRAHFYDCNDGSNIIAICRRFLSNLNHEADLYSNAIHPHYNNDDGQCGHLTFLEAFLCFYMHDNPFHRPLITRPLIGNRHDGHHGPMMWEANRRRSSGYRNRNVARNQLSL